MEGNAELLTIPEVAARLRCSRAHAAKLVAGRVKRAPPLPSLSLGRRKLVRASTLEIWIAQTESPGNGAKMDASKISAADA